MYLGHVASVDLAHIGVLAGSDVNKLFGFSIVDESKIDLLIKMDDGRKEHPTYPNNSKNIIKLSTNQLPEKICKMVEEGVKGHVTANLDYTLACFEVDRPPPRSGITCDECAKVIFVRTNFEIINISNTWLKCAHMCVD